MFKRLLYKYELIGSENLGDKTKLRYKKVRRFSWLSEKKLFAGIFVAFMVVVVALAAYKTVEMLSNAETTQE